MSPFNLRFDVMNKLSLTVRLAVSAFGVFSEPEGDFLAIISPKS